MARLLQVCNTSFYLQKFLAPLVRGLVERGNEVECVCEGKPLDPSVLGPGVVIHPFTFPRENSPLAFANAIGEMRRLILRGRYDCVDSHNRNASIVARVAAWLEQVPMNLYTAHGFYFHDDQRPIAKWATVQLEMALARVTDFTLSQSAEDVRFMTDRGYILPDRIECIGNGIDTVRFQPRAGERTALEATLGMRTGRFRVATTGRLVKGKGFDDLLDAVASLRGKIPEIELLIIGGNIDQDISPYQDTFLARARSAGLTESLVVTGITDKVDQYLATSDAFVLPSYREGLPRSLLEAMSMELPAIATNIRGCREVVTDGVSGMLFDPHGVDQLARLLEKLHGSPALRASLGVGGRRRIVEAFSETRYVDVQIAAIHRLMGEPRSRGVHSARV